MGIQLCKQHRFGTQGAQIQQIVTKVRNIRVHGRDNPSTANGLRRLGNMLVETSSSYLALPLFTEQLRIAKFCLGQHHPDLASILYRIAQIYETCDKLKEAKNYLMDALSLLNKNQRRGKIYALVTYRIGIVNYRQSLYKDAMKYFDIAIVEQKDANEEFHPAVAEMHINIGKFQLEIGILQDSMNNFLEALKIIRMTFGNNHSKVAECLYQVGLIHEARAEHQAALNVFFQALVIMKKIQDGDDDGKELALLLLHRIALVHSSMDDAEKSNDALQSINNIVSNSFGDDAKEIAFRILGYNVDDNFSQIAAAAAA